MEHIRNGKDDAVIYNNFQRKSIFDDSENLKLIGNRGR